MSMDNDSVPTTKGDDDADSRSAVSRRNVLKGLLLSLTATQMDAQGAEAQGAIPRRATSVAPGANGGHEQLFDDDWRFERGDTVGAERPEFSDARWRALDLPHDWSVENLPPGTAQGNGLAAIWGENVLPTRVGPFDSELSEGGKSVGWMVGGTGWYRKRFAATAVPAGARVEIVFDGVYMISDVWINGQHLGTHPNGYTRFAYDLTPHLRQEGENVLAVRVRNVGRNSRWYSGSGIYRHVRLRVTGECRFPHGGVRITTPEVSVETAKVSVTVRIENQAALDQTASIRIRLLDPDNRVVATREFSYAVVAGASAEASQTFEFVSPQLWSLSKGRLYRADVELLVGGVDNDRFSTTFGIRRIEVDAERGFRINGEMVKLKGGCLHHDNGLLGAAAIDRADERRVELMVRHGFNAIRTAHNPPSTAFLDACDRLGVAVIDEFFDQWEQPKNPDDYHLHFPDWWKRDIETTVLRDRNHPSVVLWSIGNEIREHRSARGVEIEKFLADWVRQLDATRPVTASVNGLGAGGLEPAFHTLDVAGCNYMAATNQWNMDKEHAIAPNRVIAGTEAFPSLAFEGWQLVNRHAWIIGDFVWTGMDHLGEPAVGSAWLNAPARFGGPGGPGTGGAGAGARPAPAPAAAIGGTVDGGLSQLGFPWFGNFSGDVDLIGESKPQWFFRQVVWGMSRLEMAVQRPLPAGRIEAVSLWGWSDELRSWTWPGYEGRTLNVRVYSNADQVRLLLNGKEIATKAVPSGADTLCKAEPECSRSGALRVDFEVPYVPGELRAVALLKGEQVAELAFNTVGRPAGLRLRPDRTTIRRSRNDLSYVTLEVIDSAGHVIPDASLPVSFAVTGVGELAGSGNASPKDIHSFRSPRPTTFRGKAVAIVRPRGIVGEIVLRAESPGLAGAAVTIRAT